MAVYAPNSYLLYRDLPLRDQPGGPSNAGACSPAPVSGGGFFATAAGRGRRSWRRGEVRAGPFWQDISRPTSIAMEPIESEEQLDQVLRRSQEEKHLVLIDWMAAWCRKCIYLKPKLEKLAAEYHPRIKFYFVDVNKVPQSLVKRGNISKMPTIQVWKDGEWKEEVIGGHKAWLVLDEVREMIQKHM